MLMHSFRKGLESVRQHRDRDGRGLGFKLGFRAGTRGGGCDLDNLWPFSGALDTGLIGVPWVTAGAISPFDCIVSDWSAAAQVDLPVDGGAEAMESVRPSFAVKWRMDSGVEDEDGLLML